MGDILSLTAARAARTPPSGTFFADVHVVEWLAKNLCPVAALTYLYLSHSASAGTRLTTMTEADLREAAGWDWHQPWFDGELERLERCKAIARVPGRKVTTWKVNSRSLAPVSLSIFTHDTFTYDAQVRFGWRQFLPAFFKIGLGQRYKLPPLPTAADNLSHVPETEWTPWVQEIIATLPDRCGHAALALSQLADAHGDVEVSLENLRRAARKTYATIKAGVDDLIAAGKLERLWEHSSWQPCAYRLIHNSQKEALRA